MSAADDSGTGVELVRRFIQRVINDKDIDLLQHVASPNVEFDHRRPGQPGGVEGLAESLVTLFNAIPDIYVELVGVTQTGSTLVADCAVSGTVLIWPVYSRPVSVDRFVMVFGTRRKKIISLQSLRRPDMEAAADEEGHDEEGHDEGYDEGYDDEEGSDYEEDDDDGGAGPAPAGPRWVPPRPVKPDTDHQPADAGPRWLPRRAGPGGRPGR